MIDSALLAQGMQLLTFGMGTVFVFLMLLVIAVNLMSALLQSCFPDPIAPETQARAVKKAPAAAVDSKTLSIIQDAIRQHRDSLTRNND
jgi:oxaloacetate decarboxylase gamma subunit